MSHAYNYAEDESWIVGNKSIHNHRPQFMRAFRSCVLFAMAVEICAVSSWIASVFVTGNLYYAGIVLFPSFIYFLRLTMLFAALVMERTPYKIASAETLGDTDGDMFPRGQYRWIRRITAHGAHGFIGMWCAVSKYVHVPVALIACLVYVIIIIFRGGTDYDTMAISAMWALAVVPVTYFSDVIIVDFGVIRPREKFLRGDIADMDRGLGPMNIV